MPRPYSVEEKIRLLESARELGSIVEACRVAGISRSTYYEIKKAFEREGRSGLEIRPKRKPRNAFSDEIVHKILELSARYSGYSSRRLAAKLGREGLAVSDSGIRKVWKRHGVATKRKNKDGMNTSSESENGPGSSTTF